MHTEKCSAWLDLLVLLSLSSFAFAYSEPSPAFVMHLSNDTRSVGCCDHMMTTTTIKPISAKHNQLYPSAFTASKP